MPRLHDLSIVIPTLNEAHAVPALLRDLAPLVAHGAELIVADGGSTDGTQALVVAQGARVVIAPRGRGRQLERGVAASTRTICFIVHADAHLPAASVAWIEGAVRTGAGPHALRLRIDRDDWRLRLIARAANWRTRRFALPYGDQGLLISRALYDRVGGYADVALMEDVLLARALRPVAPITLAPVDIVVSSRRWDREGPWRRSVRNLWLLGRFLLGAPPDALLPAYRPEPPVHLHDPDGSSPRPTDSRRTDGSGRIG